MDAEATNPTPPELREEPVEGPTPTDAPQVPDFLLDEKPKAKSPPTPVSETDLLDGNDLIVDSIGAVHDFAAEQTGYQGFQWTERLATLWRKVLKVILRKMPVKDWPVIAAAAALAIAYLTMGFGFMRWKKAGGNAPDSGPVRVISPPEGALA
jgi:hypothetical protein